MADLQIAIEDTANADGTTLVILDFDIDTEQRHPLRAGLTDFPISRGADRSDHHQAKPDEFTGTLIVTDTIGDGEVRTRRHDTWAMLMRARDEHLRCLIATTLRSYDDMYLLEADGTLAHKDGSWIRITVHFKQAIPFDTETVAIAPARPRLQLPTTLGAQTTTAVSDAALASVAQQLDDAAGGGVGGFLRTVTLGLGSSR